MSEKELAAAFEDRKPALMALGKIVLEFVSLKLVEQLGVKDAAKFFQIPPKPRVKETDSFLEKALIRKPKTDPLMEVTDQIGVRFVVLLLRDIDSVGKIIESGPWFWQKDRDFERERLDNPDYFAYQSDHYVIRTRDTKEVGGVVIPAQMPCEIQIRTVLQHAYAEMAHSSSYKPPVKLPEEDQRRVNRSLAKGSALIETTDEVFREIKVRLDDYNKIVTSLVNRSREIYETVTGEHANPSNAFCELIADTYREYLKAVTPEQLSEWNARHESFGQTLKNRRNESIFYRDAIVILLGFLVTEHEASIPKLWPVDSEFLEDFYGVLGISTLHLF